MSGELAYVARLVGLGDDVPLLAQGELDAEIERVLDGLAQPLVRAELDRLAFAERKNVRPGLLVLTGLARGADPAGVLARGAALVELAHLATLVHDDVVDRSPQRRGVTAVHAAQGDGYAIWAGDALLLHTVRGAYALHPAAGHELAGALLAVSLSQTLEWETGQAGVLSTARYHEVVAGKTASLLGGCAAIGGVLVGAADKDVEALRQFGRAFGMAFQVLDDLLDLATADTGKPVATDLRAGVPALPVILAVEHGVVTADEVRAAIGDDAAARRVAERIAASGVLDQGLEIARGFVADAVLPASWSPNPWLDALRRLPVRYLAAVESRLDC